MAGVTWRILLLQLFFITCRSNTIVNLNGIWLLRDESGDYTSIYARVPGGVYSDLMNSNIIGDIYFGYNDTETKWVPRRNWTYSRNFTVDDDVLNNDNVNIVFEGLDTFTVVYINNAVVGGSENMFRRYIFDIKNQLKVGVNQIEVQFISPIMVSARLAEDQAKNYVVPPTCPPDEYRGECNVNMLRKMQASYSWDWGPSFPSVGIWKDTFIEAYNESKLRYIGSEISDDETNWYLDVDVYLANNIRGTVAGNLSLELLTSSGAVKRTVAVQSIPNEYGEIIQSQRLTIPKDYVTAWWPNGYGGQDLYDLRVSFRSNSAEEDSRTIKIGFRVIELVQEEQGTGLSFYFKVNGVPVFMKGSNEIPLDILPERGQEPELIRNMLTTARQANMNMLRVWGGGVYESDYFYELADKYGILIWQDFMFACAMYPTYDDYLENVILEVRHQVNRLRSHPSIALFSGNNENEGALRQNWYGTGNDFDTYYYDYIKLYIDTIKAEVERITQKKRIFLSSSPSNGVESVSEGYVAQNPGDYNYGDVHFYNYVLDPWDSNIYPVCRFASEYGYQALPSFNSLLQATSNVSDLNINSDFMDHRQHHPGGNEQMKELIEFNLKLPDETHANYSKAFIYYLQIAQAVGIKIETEHYRRYSGILNSDGLGNTMGALYWQLNDVWLAPTWSGIDFTGKWKMLQYFVGDFFAPNIITGHINSERTLEVYVVSDTQVALDVNATIRVFNWNSLTPVSVEILNTNVEPGKSNLIKSLATDEYLVQQGCGSLDIAKENCFFYLSVGINNNLTAPNNYVFPASLKNSKLVTPNIKIESVTQRETSIYDIVISTDNIALFVWLETDIRGRFSENGFLIVEPTKTIFFRSEDSVSAADLLQSLSITNVLDQQYF